MNTTHGVGTEAYIDTFGGLVPCVVAAIKRTCNGKHIGHDEITVVVSKTMAGYRQGERLDRSAAYTPPRSAIVRRGIYLHIRTNYEYQANTV